MPKKAPKTNQTVPQRGSSTKKQGIQNGHQTRKAVATKRKPKKLPVGKLFMGVALVVLVLAAFGIWQYYEGQKPPAIGGGAGTSPATLSAPNFSLTDINGSQVSLNQFRGKVIGIHFMAVGCHGQINAINQYQLDQLNSTCGSLCAKDAAAFLTIAVATCESSDLEVLRNDYGVSWILGNDYDDETLEIVNAYASHEIGDGTVVLVDKDFNIAYVHTQGVSSDRLSAEIDQLSKA